WAATAAAPLSGVTVTCTQSQPGYDQSLTVIAFKGATGVGASLSGGAASGAAALTLTTTAARAVVYGVGNDWDDATARALITGRLMRDQWLDTGVSDTFWVKSWGSAIADPGTSVRLGTAGPTSDRWNFVVVEIFP